MKTNPEWHKPKTTDRSRGGIPAKKIKIMAVQPEEHPRFDALCGELHYLGAPEAMAICSKKKATERSAN